jgi:HAD superfamily phosphoserine phosphatase-like hydrolase
MRELAVFDLDGTLTPGDSFRDLALRNSIHRPRILFLALARRVGLLDRKGFAGELHRVLRWRLSDPSFVSALVNDIAASVDAERIAEVRRWREQGVFTLLLSASPHEYIEPLARKLGFDAGLGSRWHGNKYLHVWGRGKLDLLNTAYPVDAYRRVFAIGDSSSDEELLSAFETGSRCAPLRR